MRVARRLKFGPVWVNDHIPRVPAMPHGGLLVHVDIADTVSGGLLVRFGRRVMRVGRPEDGVSGALPCC